MESRQRHGTCIIPGEHVLTEFPTLLSTSTSIGDAANMWCLPPSPLWWSNGMIQLQDPLCEAAAQMAAKAWRLLPRPDYLLKDHLQYPCTANAVASIAHCHAFLFLLRAAWTKDGWMDTSEWEDLWDVDAYYAHLDDLDFV